MRRLALVFDRRWDILMRDIIRIEMSKESEIRTVGIRVRIFDDQDEGDDEDVRHHHFHFFYVLDWLTLLFQFFVDCRNSKKFRSILSFSLYLTLFKKQNSCLVWGTERSKLFMYEHVKSFVWRNNTTYLFLSEFKKKCKFLSVLCSCFERWFWIFF